MLRWIVRGAPDVIHENVMDGYPKSPLRKILNFPAYLAAVPCRVDYLLVLHCVATAIQVPELNPWSSDQRTVRLKHKAANQEMRRREVTLLMVYNVETVP